MKNYIFLTLLLLPGLAGRCQGVFNNQTNNVLEKVVQDFPKQFRNIKGELVSTSAGQAEYTSAISIPGALSTNIIQTSANHNQALCWQTVLYAGTGFDNAKKRFEELFNQIKNTIVKPEGGKAAIVNGFYIDPVERNTFTTIQFDLLPAQASLEKVNIDMLLKNTGHQWKIVLSVYDKEIKTTDLVSAY